MQPRRHLLPPPLAQVAGAGRRRGATGGRPADVMPGLGGERCRHRPDVVDDIADR